MLNLLAEALIIKPSRGGSQLKNELMTAMDFFAGQAIRPKEYFVYFEEVLRRNAEKDKSAAFILQ